MCGHAPVENIELRDEFLQVIFLEAFGYLNGRSVRMTLEMSLGVILLAYYWLNRLSWCWSILNHVTHVSVLTRLLTRLLFCPGCIVNRWWWNWVEMHHASWKIWFQIWTTQSKGWSMVGSTRVGNRASTCNVFMSMSAFTMRYCAGFDSVVAKYTCDNGFNWWLD